MFPNALKFAEVLQFIKGVIKTLLQIRGQSLSSKIFEKILKHNLIDFISKYKIILEYQYGFQENKSTSDALIELENYLCYQQANNKITC